MQNQQIEKSNQRSLYGIVDLNEEYYILDHDYLHKREDVLMKLISYWRTECIFNNKAKNFRLALIISKRDEVGNPSTAFSHHSNDGSDTF